MAGFQQLAASGSAVNDLFLSEAEEDGKKIKFLTFLVFLRSWTASRFDLPKRAADQMVDIALCKQYIIKWAGIQSLLSGRFT